MAASSANTGHFALLLPLCGGYEDESRYLLPPPIRFICTANRQGLSPRKYIHPSPPEVVNVPAHKDRESEIRGADHFQKPEL